MLLGLGAILWSVPVASIQALATADQIGEFMYFHVENDNSAFRCHSSTIYMFLCVSYYLATVPGMSWIATLNGGDVAAFVRI